MQTHEDDSHFEFLNRLRERAETMVRGKASEITAGKEGEDPLATWRDGSMYVTHMPPDEQGILRVSIGGGVTEVNLDYCVIRGGVGACIALLERAIEALRKSPE